MQNFPRDSPFYGMKITSHDRLRQCEREICGHCYKSFRYFCYSCREVNTQIRNHLPIIRTPLHIYIWKHPQEWDSKSTGIHVGLLASTTATILQEDNDRPSDASGKGNKRLPHVPYTSKNRKHVWEMDFTGIDMSRTVVLFPSKDAKFIDNVDPSSYDNVLIIEGTWQQANAMIQHPILRKDVVAHVKLKESIETTFWRFQNVSNNYLATVEAIYFFLKEHQSIASMDTPYDGSFDDLLFFYSFFYHLIQEDYNHRRNRNYTRKHRPGYIRYQE